MPSPPPPDRPTALQKHLHGARLTHLAELDTLLTHPAFTGEPPATATDLHQRTYGRLTALVAKEGGSLALIEDPSGLQTVLGWAATVDPALFHAAAVHLGVCTATVVELGHRGPYLDDLLHELDRTRAIGTILITELGRGNSHLAPATQARFHPESRSFTLHTPDPGAAKIMANVAAPGIAKTAIVYAELLVGDRPCGVFPFAVRVRTATGPGPGIRISALPEVRAVPLDYALVTFDGTPVPYEGWLRDTASITGSGRFTDPLSDPDQRLVRSTVFSANASMGAAVGLASAASACMTAALRYAEQRQTAGRLAPGTGVLDYSSQQSALYSALAHTYAAGFLVERAKSRYAQRTGSPATAHAPTWAPWASVHRGLALTKVAATRALEHAAATCRMRSGAQGLLTANRLVEYEGLAQIYQAAAGDNLLIRMDAGKSLAEDADHRPQVLRGGTRVDPEDATTVRSLAAAREAGLLTTLRRRLAERSTPAATPLDVWNPLLDQAAALADAHLTTLVLDAFDEAVTTARDSRAREPLHALRTLYGLDVLERDLAWHLESGTLTTADAARIHTAREAAVTRVHRHLPALADAMAIPPARIKAPMAERNYITALTQPKPTSTIRRTPPDKDTDMTSPTSLFSLEGKNAFVTGASRGFGREIALAYAKAGANVALLARSTDALKELATEIEELGTDALVLPCDVSNAGQITRAASDALAELGHIDIVVNNAAAIDHTGPFLDLTFQDWVQISRVNLESMLHVCYALGPHLIRQSAGSVINVASIAGTTGLPYMSFYAATKAAMISFTRSIAAEWATSGVRINALIPGWHATELTKNFLGNPEISEGIVRDIPSGRWGEPDEIAGAAVYLASDASKNATGSCLTVDGGQTAYTGGSGMLDLLKLGRLANT